MKICVVTGSRADYGLLEWPIKLLKEDPFFEVEVIRVWDFTFSAAYSRILSISHPESRPDVLMLLGDRHEILACATAAHLKRIPIAHIGGGDVTEGSYDDAMRSAISHMAGIHFVTSTSAMARLTDMGFRNVHLVGSPGIDYIKHANWKGPKNIEGPYVVVSYQAETLDGTIEMDKVFEAIGGRKSIFILPNPDRGSDEISHSIYRYCNEHSNAHWYAYLPHDLFLRHLSHCEEFIGNSSAMLYEAPELGVKVRMIGKRQRGRVIPWGDGHASERIIKALKYSHL